MVHRGGRSTTVLSDSDLAPPSSIPVQPIQPLLCHRRRRSTPPPPALPDLTGARPPLADLLRRTRKANPKYLGSEWAV
uniref:Uncharacterized protein n=1 Tax=Oryza meridionalis TaxID=40149 RepID=A0A0E0FDH4_9ORYZ